VRCERRADGCRATHPFFPCRGTTLSHIHPQALVSPHAEIGQDVVIGAFCVIEANVTIGDHCRIMHHAVIKEGTTLGANNYVGESAVLGALPQHVHMPERPGRLIVGNNNTIREYVTMHRALVEDKVTTVGDNNLFMVSAHVAHDCTVGSHAIFTNNSLLGGHVTVEDRAFVSGAVAVHQFCRIGRLAMVGGLARVTQDVPPFVMIDGATNMIVGLNSVGLRRNGYTPDEIAQLKKAYRIIYRQGLTFAEVLTTLAAEFSEGPAAEFHRFLSTGGKRGFVQERRTPPGATVRLHRGSADEESTTNQSSTQATADAA